MFKTYLNPDEIEQLENAAENFRDKLLIHTLSRTGSRISEVLGIVAEDIDFTQGTLTIQRLRVRTNLLCPKCGARLGKSHVFCPKCGVEVERPLALEDEHGRQRIIPIDKETLDLFKEYIEGGGPVLKKGKKVIFGINRHRAWQIVTECARRANLPQLINPETGRIHNPSPHRIRDSFAVNAVKQDDSGDGLRMLQEYLGHDSFNTTSKYRKVAGEELRSWYDKLWSKDKP